MFKNIELTWKKTGLILLFLCSIFLLFTSIDLSSRELIDNSFDQALVVFGSAKALNAVISLAQGTQIGVGITVSVGEVLDPINDLVEQFSWIMLASLTSLGLQKIVMNFITSSFFNILFVLSILTSIVVTLFYHKNIDKFKKMTLAFAVVIIFLRFAVPFMSILNITVYENFVKPEYNVEQLQNSIKTVEKDIETVRSESSSSILDKFLDSNKTIQKYKNLAKNASDSIVSLVIAFVFQTILFPIIFLLMLYTLLKRLFTLLN